MDVESVVTVISTDTVEVLDLAFVMEVHTGVKWEAKQKILVFNPLQQLLLINPLIPINNHMLC